LNEQEKEPEKELKKVKSKQSQFDKVETKKESKRKLQESINLDTTETTETQSKRKCIKKKGTPVNSPDDSNEQIKNRSHINSSVSSKPANK